MKHAINTMLGLSLAALAPIAVLAQEAPAPAPAPAPAGQAAPAAPAATPEEAREVFSYLMGYQFGQSLAMESSALTIDDIDRDAFFSAVKDGLKNSVDPKMREKNIPAIMDVFLGILKDRSDKISAENLAKGKAFLEENAKKEGIVTLPSGLQYRVITDAKDGRKFDEAKDGKNAICSVTYTGTLIDGTQFDASTEPVDFPINAVVPGFSEALKTMPVGSEWEVFIPAELGYGPDGPGVIGNNATLIFKLKLHDIKPGQGSAENPYELTPEIMEQLRQQGLMPVEDGEAPAAE